MRNYPDEEYEKEELKKLNAEKWMIEALTMNPDYTCWGPYEDYMSEDKGWSARCILENWDEFNFGLDDLNEVVNFYFEVSRESKECKDCSSTGYNPETKKIADAWYDFDNLGNRWSHDITQDEVQALIDSGRLKDFTHEFIKDTGWKQKEDNYTPTAAEVNEWSKGAGFGHDAINRFICVEQRAKRLGVFGMCEHCEGEGYIYTEPAARLGLVLWVLHPRKGCSRGVHVKHITKSDLPEVVKYLKEAKQRNHDRFSRIFE